MSDLDLFGEPIEIPTPGVKAGRNKSGGYILNPLLPIYGSTLGEICKHCDHLVKKQYGKTYYKCEMRGNVDKCSVVSDHKVSWPACGKFKKII